MGILVLGGVLRLLLPVVLLRVINSRIADLGEYRGHVQDLNLKLWRAALNLENIRIVYKSSGEPLITVAEVGLDARWLPLFRKQIDLELNIQDPTIHYIYSEKPSEVAKKESVGEAKSDWRKSVADAPTIRVRRIQVQNGKFVFRNPTVQPMQQFAVKDIQIEIDELTNRGGSATLAASANTDAEGKVRVKGHGLPLQTPPHFDIDLRVENINLPDLSPLLKSLAQIEIKQGTFDFYSEITAIHGKLQGYLKPMFHELEILDPKARDKKKSVGQLFKESVASVAAQLAENHPQEQIATKIPIKGDLTDPKVDVVSTIANLFKNAFVHALNPGLEHSTSHK